MAARKATPTAPKTGGRTRLHVKKGDKVVVIAGSWKSSEPRQVLKVDAARQRVVVEGVNMRWKHERRSQQNPEGGRIQKEFPIAVSNVLLYSEKAGKGVRTRIELVDGKRVRVGVPCGTKFD
ncbi:MAG: 50S ribosomal protein L24 [Planctomycetes bacterium]|nr:50S ribosomal protein L24 [Planctomycetota bacterium]